MSRGERSDYSWFPRAEYDRRLAGVRRQMSNHGLDNLVLCSPENIFYLTGFYTIGFASFQALLVSLTGEPVLIVRHMEKTVADITTWLSETYFYRDTDDPVAAAAKLLRDRGAGRGRTALENTGKFLTAASFARFREALGETVTAAPPLVEIVRRIKSPLEVGYIREACALTALGMTAAVECIRAGVSENRIAAAAYAAMIEGGSDALSADPFVTSGWRTGVPHFTFDDRLLEPGDTVFLEFAACRRRYFGPMMRTVTLGWPHDDVERLADVVEDAFYAAIATIRPGKTAAEIDAACRAVIRDGGFGDNFRRGTGYSVGIAYTPDWGEGGVFNIKPENPAVVEAGMVLHISPAVRVPEKYGVGCSQTVHVTENGFEILTNFPWLFQTL